MTRAMRALMVALLLLVAPVPDALPQQRHAVVIAGASGGEPFATRLASWRESMVAALRETLQFDAARLLVFAEDAPEALPATREQIVPALQQLVRSLDRDDLLVIVLLGHGTASRAADDEIAAKFNLVGPDLDAAEWRDLLGPLRARLVFVNTTAASFPFLERLSGPRRIVITATESIAQRFSTAFPEHFAAAFTDPAADLDKDGRVSVLEAFSAASRNVKRHYEQSGQLATERALLDDNGDGEGKWAGAPGPDGALAARTFLDGASLDATADPALAELFQRRAALEVQLDDLRARKPLMSAEDYAREFETLMVDLARVSREIRRRRT
jgi:hypothetical protein